MKIQSSSKKIYEIQPPGKKKIDRIKCPNCVHTHSSRKQNQKDMAWDNENNRGYCHRCQESYFEYKPYEQKKEYFIPEWKNKTELTDKAVKYWNGRKITQETLIKCNVYSDKEWMPQFNKEVEVVCFPFLRNGELKNIKFRGAKKSMKLVKGAELLFLNEDALKFNKEIIIVEGEPDYLTYVEAGYSNVMSVPNGASIRNMVYFDTVADLFQEVREVYIAVDNDTEGLKLRDELIRRIGAEKCKLVNYKDCKDANDYMVKHGGLEFKNLLKDAKDVPVNGVVEMPDIYQDLVSFFEYGIQRGKEIGDSEIDQFVTWELGRLVIVTGIPGSGKSEIVDYIITKMNLVYGWKAAYYSPENYPLKYHYSKLFEKFNGKKFHKDESNETEFDLVYEHIKDNFFYILDDYDMTLEQILISAEYYVKKRGINILVIDPYNRIEHDKKGNERDDQYVSRFLNKLDKFGKLNNLLIFLVAHPITIRDGHVPTLYDISGGSNFFNKAEYGFTVNRQKDEDNAMTNNVEIYWQKIKFKHLGKQGITNKKYNYNNGRLEDGSVDGWDNSNWLMKNHQNDEDVFVKAREDEAPF